MENESFLGFPGRPLQAVKATELKLLLEAFYPLEAATQMANVHSGPAAAYSISRTVVVCKSVLARVTKRREDSNREIIFARSMISQNGIHCYRFRE